MEKDQNNYPVLIHDPNYTMEENIRRALNNHTEKEIQEAITGYYKGKELADLLFIRPNCILS